MLPNTVSMTIPARRFVRPATWAAFSMSAAFVTPPLVMGSWVARRAQGNGHRARGCHPIGARSRECPQAGADPCGRLQHRAAPAPPDRHRYAPKPAGAGFASDFPPDRTSDRPLGASDACLAAARQIRLHPLRMPLRPPRRSRASAPIVPASSENPDQQAGASLR